MVVLCSRASIFHQRYAQGREGPKLGTHRHTHGKSKKDKETSSLSINDLAILSISNINNSVVTRYKNYSNGSDNSKLEFI